MSECGWKQVQLQKLVGIDTSKQERKFQSKLYRIWFKMKERGDLYDRALKYLPGSYKLWHNYLKDCVAHMEMSPPMSRKFQIINETFERALIFMNKV